MFEGLFEGIFVVREELDIILSDILCIVFEFNDEVDYLVFCVEYGWCVDFMGLCEFGVIFFEVY